MLLLGIDVVVGEVGVEGVVVEGDPGVGVRGGLPGLLGGEHGGGVDGRGGFGVGVAAAMMDGGAGGELDQSYP